MTSGETRGTLQIWNNAAFDDGHSQIAPDSDPIRSPPAKSKTVKFQSGVDEMKRDIDAEIQEVEKEVKRLTTKLEALRLEKAEQTARSVATRGRIVPAKFMLEGSTRRGVSLGPGEIFSASKTPLHSAQNRRKSCFFKLPGIEARGRTSLSLSPRSRKAASKSTVGGLKRALKKDQGVLLSIHPKRLFSEDDKNVASRKPGRVVPSRYSLISKTQTLEKQLRKRSLPDNQDKGSDSKTEGRVKKRWELPTQVDLYTTHDTPIGKELPKITTLRRDSPRDSGAAKRVAELESKNRNFTFSQLLSFEE